MRLLKLPTGDWIHPAKVVAVVNKENWDGTNYNKVYTVTMDGGLTIKVPCGEHDHVPAKVNELAAQINECLQEGAVQDQPQSTKP